MCLAIPGRILSLSGDDALSRTGRVSFGGVVREVSLACVPEAGVDDYVMVHVGFALSRVDREEAERVFGLLEEMGELDELTDDVKPSPGPDGAPGRMRP